MKKYVSQSESLKRIAENAHDQVVRERNATRGGQAAMEKDAASRAPAFQMNKIVKSKGGVGFPDDMIESANSILLHSIKDNLIKEYNELLTAEACKWDEGDPRTPSFGVSTGT